MTGFDVVDLIGFAAAAATLATFAQTNMLPMRVAAIAANLLFITYGAVGPLYPVLVLHLVLLPLNAKRLMEQLNTAAQAQSPLDVRRLNRTLLEDWRRR